MKKLVFSMLAMVAMVSCTNESDPIDNGGPQGNQQVEIKPSAGIVASKAAVLPEFTDDLKVQFFRPADAETASWGTGTSLFATISGSSGHTITFNNNASDNTEKKQFYNADATQKSWLAGCYLGSASGTLTNGKVTFTIDGTQDIMATDGKSGTKTTVFEGFQFNHMLSQIQVILKGDAAAQSYFGKVTKVELKDLATNLDLTLGAKPSIKKNDSALENETIALYSNVTGVSINASGETLPNIPMVFKTGNTINLTITSENGGASDVAATITGGIDSGKKHVITLTFKEKITATATVAEWTEGNAGTGEVE